MRRARKDRSWIRRIMMGNGIDLGLFSIKSESLGRDVVWK
jgi:hypothetical protein